MRSLMKEPSSKNKPKTGNNRLPEDDLRQKGKNIVIERAWDLEPDDPSDTETENQDIIRKKIDKKNKKTLEREEEAEDPVPRHKKLPYVGIPDLNSHVKNVVENYDPVSFEEKRPVAYKHLAPIENVKNEEEALDSLLKAPVTISAEVLMSISPGVRQELFKALAKKKVPVQSAQNRKVTMVEEVDEDAPQIKIINNEPKIEKIDLNDLNIRATFM